MQSFRRRIGAIAGAGLLVASVTAGMAMTRLAPRQDADRGTAGAPIELDLVILGLERPVQVTNAGDGTNRLFAVEKEGRVRIIQNGQLLTTPFLNIEDRVEDGGNEQGLLSVAFHPDYETNRRFFVYYTGRTPTEGGIVIAEYQAMAGNPNVASTSERRIIEISALPGRKSQWRPSEVRPGRVSLRRDRRRRVGERPG